MGRLDKSYAHNAGARDPAKPRITYYKGERRSQIWPSGTVERFVNLQGTVVQVPLVAPGVPATPEAIGAARAKLHRMKTVDGEIQGYIEHNRCPLRHGTRELSETLRDEFAKMPANLQSPCSEDPITFKRTKKGIEYFDSCPHVEWVIKSRKARHTALSQARHKRQKTVLQMEQEKVDLLRQQSEAQTKILERVAEKIEATPTRTRKQNTEPSE